LKSKIVICFIHPLLALSKTSLKNFARGSPVDAEKII